MTVSREPSSSAASPQPREGEWRTDFENAKDGREVLLAVKMRAGIPNCRFVGHWMPGGHCIDDHPPIDACWYFWNGCMFDKASEPTGWMPLPAPPVIAEKREKS